MARGTLPPPQQLQRPRLPGRLLEYHERLPSRRWDCTTFEGVGLSRPRINIFAVDLYG